MRRRRRREEEEEEEEEEDSAKITLCTINTSGWKTTESFINSTSSSIIFVQEHKLLPDKFHKKTTELIDKGWKVYGSPAVGSADGPP
eukprot:640437-Pyramimonas_sp.AAC.1